MRFLLTLLVALLCVIFATAMRKQGVAVKGTLKCGGHSGQQHQGPDPDDTLDEKRLDATGTFSLTGSTHELTPIDPVLYIWHECRDEQTPCSRKVKFVIPKKFIHGGEPKPEQWIDIGVLNLEGSFLNEGRECRPEDNFYIFWASHARTIYMGIVCSVGCSVTFERYVATIYVATYEFKKFKWLPILLISAMITGSVIFSFIMHDDRIPLWGPIILGLISTVVAVVICSFLFKKNKQNLFLLQNSSTAVQKQYSLSVRYQLNENVMIMQMLKNVIFVVGTVNSIEGMVLTAISSEHVGNCKVTKMYLFCLFNDIIGVYATAVPLVGGLSVKKYRKLLFKQRIIRIWAKPLFYRFFPEDFETRRELSTSDDTEIYFSKLTTQWDKKFCGLAEPNKVLHI